MAKKINYLHLKYIPTGNIFKLPDKEAKEILKNDRENYIITDKNFNEDIVKAAETTVSQKVIAEE